MLKLNARHLPLLLLILAGVLLILFATTLGRERKLITSFEENYSAHQLTEELRLSSNDLTRMARSYVVTGDPKFKKQFFDVLAIRNGVKPRPKNYNWVYWDFQIISGEEDASVGRKVSFADLVSESNITEEERFILLRAREESDRLAEIEAHGFALAEKGEREEAFELLFGEEYHLHKIQIFKELNTVFSHLERERIKTRNAAIRSANLYAEGQFVAFLITLGIIALVVTWSRAKQAQRIAELGDELVSGKKRLAEAEASLQQLKGLILICSSCHNVRDKKGAWGQLEHYISEHSDAMFSHGICPDCKERALADLGDVHNITDLRDRLKKTKRNS